MKKLKEPDIEKQIYDTDDAILTAQKIYFKMGVLESVAITGFHYEGIRLEPKGDKVLEELRKLDIRDNVNPEAIGRTPRRKRKILPNSIGGYVAQKIFRFKIDQDKTTIWRVQ